MAEEKEGILSKMLKKIDQSLKQKAESAACSCCASDSDDEKDHDKCCN